MQPAPPDRFLEGIVQRTALRMHDAECVYGNTLDRPPASPRIEDEDHITLDERADVGDYLAAYDAYTDQLLAAKAELDDARGAYADAHRLATGDTLTATEAAVVGFGVMRNGASWICADHTLGTPPSSPIDQAAPRTASRARGAGRPAARATRSSAASGDSGDEGPGEPAAAPAQQQALAAADSAGQSTMLDWPGRRTTAMRKPAVLRVRRPSGATATFVAEHAAARGGLIVAVGRWKGSLDPLAEYAWSAGRVLEVHWGAER